MDLRLNYFDTGYGRRPKRKPAAKLKPKTAKAPVARPARAEAAAKPKAPRVLPVVAETLASEDADGSCLRSPCGVDRDPQLSDAEIRTALAFVQKHGGSKKEVAWPQGQAWREKRDEDGEVVVQGAPWKPCGYMTVAFGGGVDSSAILVGLDQLWRSTREERWVPRAVTFADTGGEGPHTYDWIRLVDHWLREKAFRGAAHRPAGVVKIGSVAMQVGEDGNKPGYGTAQTLEISSLINHTLPAISFHKHTCSTKWKIEAQRVWIDGALQAGVLPQPRDQQQIARAIGYDATETGRLEKSSTYVATDEEKATRESPKIFEAWYPLMEWGWNRARCFAEIMEVFDSAPRKSSCWFCGAMKPAEVRTLAEDYPDLLARAVFMELVFIHGRNPPKSEGRGLSQGIRWLDMARGHVPGSPLWTAYVSGGVVRGHDSKKIAVTQAIGSHGVMNSEGHYVAFIPKPGTKPSPSWFDSKRNRARARAWTTGEPIPLYKGERYIPPARIKGVPVGRLMSEPHLQALEKLAKAWVAASPDRPGQLSKDMALHPLAAQIPAFAQIKGFRATGELTFDRLSQLSLPEAEEAGDRQLALKLKALISRLMKARRNPGRRLPVVAPAGVDVQVPGGVERDPLLSGGF